MAPTYFIEISKSGRSSCKDCKEKIENGSIRIGRRDHNGEYDMMSYVHPKCVNKKKHIKHGGLEKGDDGPPSLEVFIANLEGIENFDADGLVKEALENTSPPKSKTKVTTPKKREGDDLVDTPTPKKIKNQAVLDINSMTEEELAAKAAEDGESVDYIKAYAKYNSMKLDSLKDLCRWNKTKVTGTKSELLRRCCDGLANGGLGKCPECKGKLTISNDGKEVNCTGAYDETMGTFVRCYFKCAADKMKRTAWYEEKPSDDDEGESTQTVAGIKAGTAKYANLLDSHDLSNRDGKKAAAKALLGACRELGIKISQNDTDGTMAVGALMLTHTKDGKIDSVEALNALVAKYGTEKSVHEANETAAAACGHPDNVAIVAIFSDLASCYKQEGNHNAMGTYKKAAAALRALTVKITSGKSQFKGP